MSTSGTDVKMLFVCSTEVDSLAQAVDELERLAGPGGDLNLFIKVLQLDAALTSPAAMDLDTEEEGVSSSRANSSRAKYSPRPASNANAPGALSSSTATTTPHIAARLTAWSGRRSDRSSHEGSSPASAFSLPCPADRRCLTAPPGRRPSPGQWQWRCSKCAVASGSQCGGCRQPAATWPARRSSACLRFHYSERYRWPFGPRPVPGHANLARPKHATAFNDQIW